MELNIDLSGLKRHFFPENSKKEFEFFYPKIKKVKQRGEKS